jgi:hypothetical protein
MVAYHTASELDFSDVEGCMTRVSCIIAAVMLCSGLAWGIAAAQQRVMVIGTVQWTSTNRVQMMTDGGVSVSIDVSQLNQTDYTSVRSGNRLRVTGYVAPDRTRLIADSMEPDVWSGFPQAS